MELTRRGFIKITGAGLAASSLGALGFGSAGQALAAEVRPFKLTRSERDPQHLHLLLGLLRHPDLQPGRRRQERALRHHPYRGRSRPPGEPRHALPEGLGAARYRPRPDPPQGTEIPRAGQRANSRGVVGLRARPHRPADEGRPRQAFHRQERGRDTVNRWTTTGMLAASASSNETAFLTWKVARSLGMVVFDNQARV